MDKTQSYPEFQEGSVQTTKISKYPKCTRGQAWRDTRVTDSKTEGVPEDWEGPLAWVTNLKHTALPQDSRIRDLGHDL